MYHAKVVTEERTLHLAANGQNWADALSTMLVWIARGETNADPDESIKSVEPLYRDKKSAHVIR